MDLKKINKGYIIAFATILLVVIDQIVKLRRAGVGFWYTGHVKRRSNDDAFSGETYDMITTNMSQRYFAAIRNKSHAIGIAYIDRTLTQQEVGKENPITKEKKTITRVVSESRKVKFRDDSYTADSKSRLAYITEEVMLDADDILKALKDAINSANGVSAPIKPTTKKTTKKPEVVETYPDEEDEVVKMAKEALESANDNVDSTPFDAESEIDDIFEEEGNEPDVINEMITLNADRLAAIRSAFKSADASVKAKVKSYLTAYGNKLTDTMSKSDVDAIESVLGLSDEV